MVYNTEKSGQEFKARSCGQEQKEKPWINAATDLHFMVYHLVCNSTQNDQPWNGATSIGLGTLISMSN